MKFYLPLFITIILGGCSSFERDLSTGIPKPTLRNRLLGELPSERTCYDVQHYDINIDIDVDKKYLKGYVVFTALSVTDFKTLQIDLAKSMKLNSVEYKGEILNTNRKEDAVYINFPKILIF